MNKKHIGAHSELSACAWLLREGYEVFRNISQFGIVDVVAIKGGEVLKLDVKTAPKSSWAAIRVSEAQELDGVALLLISPDGECAINRSPQKQASVNRECLNCGEAILNTNTSRKFCGSTCRGIHFRKNNAA